MSPTSTWLTHLRGGTITSMIPSSKLERKLNVMPSSKLERKSREFLPRDRQSTTNISRWGASRSGPSRPRPSLNMLTVRSETAPPSGLRRPQRDAANTLAAMGNMSQPQISQKDMRQFYKDEEWQKRTNRDRPALASDPCNAHLFARDQDSQGRPYCLRCRRTGHNLANCKAKPAERRPRPDSKNRGGGVGRAPKRARP